MRLERELDDLAAEIDFAGVVRVDHPGQETLAKAYGLAHRGYAIPNTVDTRFALASMTKGFTALAVVSLIEQGTIELGTTARSLLGTDLPLIAEDVTVEQLLAHRSGIGDYLDEELHPDVAEYVMPVPVHELATPRTTSPSWTAIRRRSRPASGSPTTTVPTSCSRILAERAGGDAVSRSRGRARLPSGGHARHGLPEVRRAHRRVAQGYIDVDGRVRSNVLHLPVRGVGDGGAYSTVADMRSFWTGSSRATSCRPSGSPRWSGHGATRRSTADATGSASGSIRRAMSSSSKAPMPGSPVDRSMTRRRE